MILDELRKVDSLWTSYRVMFEERKRSKIEDWTAKCWSQGRDESDIRVSDIKTLADPQELSQRRLLRGFSRLSATPPKPLAGISPMEQD